MRTICGSSLQMMVRQALLPGIAFALAACEKPKLRTDAPKEAAEPSLAEKPDAPFPPPGQSADRPAKDFVPGTNPPAAQPVEVRQEIPREKPALDAKTRAAEYARQQKRLNAQLVGIRSLESDLARHSTVLNQLRSQLQAVRALQAGARSGGIRVERIGGESTVVDRAAEARELEAKIKAEEPLVAQLSKALQGARQEFVVLQSSMNQLLGE